MDEIGNVQYICIVNNNCLYWLHMKCTNASKIRKVELIADTLNKDAVL